MRSATTLSEAIDQYTTQDTGKVATTWDSAWPPGAPFTLERVVRFRSMKGSDCGIETRPARNDTWNCAARILQIHPGRFFRREYLPNASRLTRAPHWPK